MCHDNSQKNLLQSSHLRTTSLVQKNTYK
jgi:hypothetical protein